MTAEMSSHVLPESELVPSTLTFPVVGLGASAGGLTPLMSFFERMPADAGMAFVVVVHLSPKHVSNLPSLLQATTGMRVISADEPMNIEPNTVYVIPPDKLLSMNDSYLRVTAMERPRGRHVAIDLFFRTLAIVHRERAIAIVLSGSGADGAVGITRIKEEGGISIVQDPIEAEFDGMPRAATATGTIDWVLPVAEMPAKLVELWDNARRIEMPEAETEGIPEAASPSVQAANLAEEALREILSLLRVRTGHDFRHYKRATVLRRLERRLQVHGLPNLPAYRVLLQAQLDETQALLKDLLIGVTNFFRDAEAFDSLQREAIAPLFEQADGRPAGLRVWVAGCASGEEAYSVAILLCEQAAMMAQAPKIHLFATDIDERAIAQARSGAYPVGIETDVEAARLRRHFDREGNQYRIRKEVREKVMFAVHNLLHDPPFSKLDLISCRNLLIYLDREVHAEVLEMFHFALNPGGYLFLGSSESADTASPFFTVVDKKHRLFRANVRPRTARHVPMLATAAAPALPPQQASAGTERRTVSYMDLHRRLAEQYAPPSVLIDADSNIVHLSAQASRFLRHAAGAPSHNLLTLVQPELRLELRSAIFQALSTGKSVEARRVRTQRDGKDHYVNMIARPVSEPELSVASLVLVLFDSVEDSMSQEARAAGGPEGRDPMLAQLEAELARTKEQLQDTIEHADTSTEELKASNEELQAINEELRSTTEELETSKEELQSINEELVTVNHELKSKVEETGKINDDLQNLITSTDIATVFVDRAMSIKRFTPPAVKLFNLIPSDVGRSLLDITHKLDYERLADDAAEAFRSLRVIEREMSTQSGRWYLARVLPYRTTEDRIDGAVLTFIDITGRRKAEETMRLIAESTRDFAIIMVDLDGRIGMWNEGAEKVFGYIEAEALGQPVSMLYLPEDRESGVVENESRQAREHGRAEGDRWQLRKDGSRIFCSGITTPMRQDGRLVGYSKVSRDLTGDKRVDNDPERRWSEESAHATEVQAASELKDEFLAVMSHELKNPLNLIQLNAELLVRLPEARDLPAVQRAAGIIRRTVVSQAQIIDDLLDLSRINTGKLALNRVAVDWPAVVDTIASAMSHEAAGRGITLSVEATREPLFVDADPVRVEQVAWNLVANAVKFTPAGGSVTLALSRDGEFARFDVTDTGRGIAPEMLPRVYEMFKQASDSGSSRTQGGLGIGLAVVRSLAALHGGRVEAVSKGLGRGARFSVWLPLAAQQKPSKGGEAAVNAARLANRHILVVDDDPPSVDTLRRLLENEGMRVTQALSPAEAIAQAKTARFDVVLSEIAMAQMDGRALVEALQREPRNAGVPVIAVTGLGRPADVRRALDAGFRAHLTKPVALDRLLSTLSEVLGRAGS